jgi:hypothetical protein
LVSGYLFNRLATADHHTNGQKTNKGIMCVELELGDINARTCHVSFGYCSTCEQQFLKVKAKWKFFLHQITVRVRFFIYLVAIRPPAPPLDQSAEFKRIFQRKYFLSSKSQRMCSGVNVRCTTATTCRQERDVKHENIPPSFVSHFFVASSVTS